MVEQYGVYWVELDPTRGIHKYGGFGEEAFNDNSEKQVFVCQ